MIITIQLRLADHNRCSESCEHLGDDQTCYACYACSAPARSKLAPDLSPIITTCLESWIYTTHMVGRQITLPDRSDQG